MTLPAHFFVSDTDGALYDTRDPNWSKAKPVRTGYRLQHADLDADPVQALHQVKAALRAGPFTALGAYPLYFVTRDGAALSFDAAREQFAQVCDEHLNDYSAGWRIAAVQINYEDGDLVCDHTGKRIDSAYAEDEGDAA